jgi:hypothetical protein
MRRGNEINNRQKMGGVRGHPFFYLYIMGFKKKLGELRIIINNEWKLRGESQGWQPLFKKKKISHSNFSP